MFRKEEVILLELDEILLIVSIFFMGVGSLSYIFAKPIARLIIKIFPEKEENKNGRK